MTAPGPSRPGSRPTGSAPACSPPCRTASRFDAATGEPSSWLEHSGAPTWWGWSQDWLALKWPQWSGHSRRSAVESLTLLTPLLVKDGAAKAAGGARLTGCGRSATGQALAPDGAPADLAGALVDRPA